MRARSKIDKGSAGGESSLLVQAAQAFEVLARGTTDAVRRQIAADVMAALVASDRRSS